MVWGTEDDDNGDDGDGDEMLIELSLIVSQISSKNYYYFMNL